MDDNLNKKCDFWNKLFFMGILLLNSFWIHSEFFLNSFLPFLWKTTSIENYSTSNILVVFFPWFFPKHSVDYEKSCNFFLMASKRCFGSFYDQQLQGSRISAKTTPPPPIPSLLYFVDILSSLINGCSFSVMWCLDEKHQEIVKLGLPSTFSVYENSASSSETKVVTFFSLDCMTWEVLCLNVFLVSSPYNQLCLDWILKPYKPYSDLCCEQYSKESVGSDVLVSTEMNSDFFLLTLRQFLKFPRLLKCMVL